MFVRLNSFGLSVDSEGWWFEHSISWSRVYLSAEGAENVFWPWLSLLRGWDSLTTALTGKFVYIQILKLKEELKRIKVTFISELAGKICGWLKNFFPKKVLPSQASELTVENLGGHCKPMRSRGRVPEINVFLTPGSHISRLLSEMTENHVMDSIFNWL